MCAVSSEAPLLSGLQKAVLSVQGVIAVFSSERGKTKAIFQLEAWHYGNPVTSVLVEQTDKKPPRGYENSVCQAGNDKMPAIELCADFNDQFLGKPRPHQSYLYR